MYILTPVIMILCAVFSSFSFLNRRLLSLFTFFQLSISQCDSESLSRDKRTSLSFVNHKHLSERYLKVFKHIVCLYIPPSVVGS